MTTVYGDNAQVPGIASYEYKPDQLIAGQHNLVTSMGVIGGGAALVRGTVLGQKSSGDVGSAVAGGSNTGNGTISSISKGASFAAGVYTLTFTGATAYTVKDPLGVTILTQAGAGAVTTPEINFTFTAGSTAMVAGDTFTIELDTSTGVYIKSASAASDGSQVPIAILADDVDATAGDVRAPIYVSGEFNGRSLTLGTGWTVDTVAASLRDAGIHVKRLSVSNADPT